MTAARFGAMPKESYYVSVVIPCRNRPMQLDTCLSAVEQLSPAPDEVIVVDSDSSAQEVIREVAHRHGAHYLRAEKPGSSVARNLGARNAKGQIVVFLDDDAIPDREWIKYLVRPFCDPRVACVTGKIVPRPDDPARSEYELLGYTRSPFAPCSISKDDPEWFRAACFGGIGSAGNLSIRKAAYEKWPGFCERLGLGTAIAGNDEGRAFLDLVRLNYSIRYSPEALVWHPIPFPTRESLQRRYYTNLAASTAFVLMLMLEDRGCRWQASRYLLGKLCRVSPLWRRKVTGSAQVSLAPAWRVVLARATGILCYLRSVTALLSSKFRADKK